MSEPKTKLCSRCHKRKSRSQFHAYKRSRDGLQGYCKTCAAQYQRDTRPARREACAKWYRTKGKERTRDHRLRTLYGITLEEYREMLAAQNGGCAICGGTNPDGTDLAVDHAHDTGMVRALLCGACNLMIACEDPDRLEKGAAYLRRFGRGSGCDASCADNSAPFRGTVQPGAS